MVIAKDKLDEFKDILEKRKKLALETAPHIVHGFMFYRCYDCGRTYYMYLEKGLEDRVMYEVEGKHKPVPFGIVCPKCFGSAYHIAWGVGSSDKYEELESGKNFFMNVENEDCGIPVIFDADDESPLDKLVERSVETPITPLERLQEIPIISFEMLKEDPVTQLPGNRFERRHSKKFKESRYVRPRKNERTFH